MSESVSREPGSMADPTGKRVDLVIQRDRQYVLEAGVLNATAILAFTNGHCHSLAMALKQSTGGDLVCLQRIQDPFDHVLCCLGDGSLADIGGARSPAEVLRKGGRLESVTSDDLFALPATFAWEPPDPDLAAAWVTPVLERAASGQHLQPPILRCIQRDPEDGFEVLFEWTEAYGGVTISGFVATPGVAGRWSHVLDMGVPRRDGVRVIEFTEEALGDHAQGAMSRFGERMRQRITTPCSPLQPTYDSHT